VHIDPGGMSEAVGLVESCDLKAEEESVTTL